MNKTGLYALLAIIAGLATACAVTPEAETGTEELAVSIGGDDGPPDPPEACIVNSCSNTYQGGYVTTAQQSFNCSQTYRYYSNASAGFLGGLASFCPATSTVLTYLRNHNYRGFSAGYCDNCVTVPAGKVFVFWTEWWGPLCPSGCEPAPGPGPL